MKSVLGEEMSRSYTVVPCNFFTKQKVQHYTSDNICLMVKSYPNGNISKYVCSKCRGDQLEVSKQFGDFDLHILENKEMYIFLAAGTGITPMLGLLLFALERRSRRS